MSLPQLQKNWTISPNIRKAYTSLLDCAGWYAYENKTRMLAVGWTVKFTSSGSAGPSSANDATDRITSAAAFATRATAAGAPQSWFVLQNPDGLQIMFTYQGASDDVIRVSFSPRGLFTLAATATHQPTATDEVATSGATSVVNATTSMDRVMSIFCASDGSAWRCALFRSGALVSCLSVDKVTPIAPSSTFPYPYIGGKFLNCSRDLIGSAVSTGDTPVSNCGGLSYALGTANVRGFSGSIFTAGVIRACRMYGTTAMGHGLTFYGNTSQMLDASQLASTYCASMGGSGALVWPIVVWGEDAVNFDGPWGVLIDWTQMMTASVNNPAAGNFVPGLDVADASGAAPRTNWFVAIGAAAIWPWKNVTASLEMV